jgi:hypothetical protein
VFQRDDIFFKKSENSIFSADRIPALNFGGLLEASPGKKSSIPRKEVESKARLGR